MVSTARIPVDGGSTRRRAFDKALNRLTSLLHFSQDESASTIALSFLKFEV